MVEDRFVADVGSFHSKFGLDALEPAVPAVPSDEMLAFRLNFMLEELAEIAAANDFVLEVDEEKDMKFVKIDEDIRENAPSSVRLEETLDGLVDLLYVLMGTVRFCGFHTNSPFGQRFHEAWRRVQQANMAKTRAASSGDSKRGTSFDVVKPVGWVPPTLKDLV
jgi:predicted HAD superfamily Cof-like phosphohydrolase